MEATAEAHNPRVELANKDWVGKELIDTERRIEKAFHEQTQFLSQKTDRIQQAYDEQKDILSQKYDAIHQSFHEQTAGMQSSFNERTNDLKREIIVQTRWMVGLMVTMTIAIIIAVLFKN